MKNIDKMLNKMIELADKKHRWGKLWAYIKELKSKEVMGE